MVEAVAGKKEFEVTGFDFYFDDLTKFDPYTPEAAAAAGYPIDPAAPTPDGFIFITDEYEAYIKNLIKTG